MVGTLKYLRKRVLNSFSVNLKGNNMNNQERNKNDVGPSFDPDYSKLAEQLKRERARVEQAVKQDKHDWLLIGKKK